ncbi:phage baseplate assembly protein V [Pantoea sp.]|uniref:phage baseplate assembly protein V n=1 Tax=Pantoea sp. TaxID=69393 RepID=UPI00289FA795|nr:phage baseplate assembly protein V [Pantoea sp.]
MSGRIESPTPDQPYSWLDANGRYRVRMAFDRDDGEPESAWLWLRFIRPTAGEKQGWHMPLLAGTEVGVAFHFGDPDRPYIAHAFHDSAHPDIVNRDNRSQNILRTAAGNALRMEDRRGEASINLATPYGATQLNQGQIPGERLPEFEDKHGRKHPVCWSLLERDDKGSVFVIAE